MEWTKCLDLDTLFIKIDFKKSYDKVEWPFIFPMLKTLQFGPCFLRVVELETNFSKASSYLSINKCKLEEVGLFMSIHQGCP